MLFGPFPLITGVNHLKGDEESINFYTFIWTRQLQQKSESSQIEFEK